MSALLYAHLQLNREIYSFSTAELSRKTGCLEPIQLFFVPGTLPSEVHRSKLQILRNGGWTCLVDTQKE